MINNYKYMRIQGREIAEHTDYANGVFGIFRDFEKHQVMTKEDYELYLEIVEFYSENLPWPPMCNENRKVICFFKTEASSEMMKHMKPLLWLLERYNHPYDVVLTNFPGNIVYEDEFQVVVTVDELVYDDADIMQEDIFENLAALRKKKKEEKEG